MRITTVLRALAGLKHTRATGFRFTETELVVGVASAKRTSFVRRLRQARSTIRTTRPPA